MIRIRTFSVAALGLLILTACEASAGTADVTLTPASQSVPVGSIVEVKIALTSSSRDGQSFDSLDVIFSWDPTRLDFLSSTQVGAGYGFFIAGFLPNPDGINLNLDDGLAVFTALGPPGAMLLAPPAPETDVVTTLRFLALAPTTSTLVDIVPQFGTFSSSRVLLGGTAVTGSIDADAEIVVIPAACGSGDSCFCAHGNAGCDDSACCTAVCALDPSCCALAWDTACATAAASVCPCRADITADGVIDGADLGVLLGAWGTCGCCPSDLTSDGVVDGADLGTLLGAWGTCS